MPLISWTMELSLDVKSIDEQHKQLLQKLNELHDAITHGGSRGAVGRLLSEGLQLTADHFAHEEKLMHEFHYPGLEEHRKEHESLIMQTKDVAHYFASGGRLDVHSLEVNFRDWWQKHIRTTDRELSLFLISKGVK